MTLFRTLLALLIGFSIPLSTALTNLLCPLVLLPLLIEGNLKQRISTLLTHPSVKPALLLFSLMLLGLLHTAVPLTEALRMLDKYRELLYVPFFIALFRDDTSRRLGLTAFFTAIGLTVFLSYLTVFTDWSIGKGTTDNPFIFKNHITQGILVSLAAYLLAVHAFHTPRWRLGYAFAILPALYSVIFMTQGRTGYIIAACLILLFCYQSYRLRGLSIGILIITALGLLAYNSSETVHNRISKVTTGFQDYQQGHTTASIPARIEFIKNSITLITNHLILGTGTGSFTHEYEQLARIEHLKPTTNPHNEYLMIAVQWGLIGVGLFIYWFYRLWRTTRDLSTPTAWMMQGLIITMAVGCLFNSLLLDNTEGHLFVYLIGVFSGGLMQTEANLKHCIGLSWPFKRCTSQGESYRPFLPYICPQHQGQFFVILIILLISYHLLTLSYVKSTLTIDEKAVQAMVRAMEQSHPQQPHPPTPFTIDNRIAHHFIEATRHVQLQPLAQRNNEAFGTSIVDTEFQWQIKNDHAPNLTVSLTDTLTLSSHLTIDKYHVGKAAHIVIVAYYRAEQSDHDILLQPTAKGWMPLEGNVLQSSHYYAKLPEHIDVLIYQGTLKATGQLKVFVGYVLDNNVLVINQTPMQLQVKE